MKKLLVFAVMISLVLGIGIVVADNVPQDIGGGVIPDMTFIPTPNPLDFGNILPGDNGDVVSNLTVGNSNLRVEGISVASITGTVFTDANVKFSVDNGLNFDKAGDVPVIPISAQTSKSIIVRLTIPVGTFTENFTGTITYTVMEDI